jgi:NAD-dependent DNA ligase
VVVQAVLDKQQHVPVVTSRWVTECQQTGQRLPYNSYSLPVLASCTISFTNVAKRRRTALAKHIEELGGKFAPDMGRHCSYLVVGDQGNSTDKLRCSLHLRLLRKLRWNRAQSA